MIDRYSDRARVIKAILIAVGAIFVIRLAVLQVFNNKYKSLAERQSLRNITIYPARGLVYDRNGELLVYNDVVYDLMVVPREAKGIDTAYFCKCLGIERQDFEERMRKAQKYSSITASICLG